MSTLSVDLIEPVGSTLTLGQSGDTITIPSGGTFTNSGTATGFGGLVTQVLEHNLNTTISTTSTSYVASGLTITITPASTSSRFLLMLAGGQAGPSSGGETLSTTFYVGGSEVAETGPYSAPLNAAYGYPRYIHGAMCLHSPATVSATTYAVFYKTSGVTMYFNVSPNRIVFTVTELSS
jgi:hypothetical protein